MSGTYGYRLCKLVYDHITKYMDVKNKHYLVIGSAVRYKPNISNFQKY